MNRLNFQTMYDNMLYAQIDVVCASIKALGHTDVRVRISETGWPSKGDVDEPEATVENVEIYNRTCCKGGQGTPAHPSQRIDIYVFALFNENMKPGPTFERIRGTMDCIILM
nr:glucan endo-1,3-beta-glucosidase 14-like [Tanacetum cinerariifolium]